MNLKEANGLVPVRTNDKTNPYRLVPFPKRDEFDRLLGNRIKQDAKDKWWDVLQSRARGATLQDAGHPFSIQRERVRQMEAKFLRLMSSKHAPQSKSFSMTEQI